MAISVADSNVCETLHRLHDHLDILALLVGRVEKLEAAKLGKHLPNLRLKNDDHGHGEKRREDSEQPSEHLQFKKVRNQSQSEKQHQCAR